MCPAGGRLGSPAGRRRVTFWLLEVAAAEPGPAYGREPVADRPRDALSGRREVAAWTPVASTLTARRPSPGAARGDLRSPITLSAERPIWPRILVAELRRWRFPMKNFDLVMRGWQEEWRALPGNVSTQEWGKQNGERYLHVLPKNVWEEGLWPEYS